MEFSHNRRHSDNLHLLPTYQHTLIVKIRQNGLRRADPKKTYCRSETSPIDWRYGLLLSATRSLFCTSMPNREAALVTPSSLLTSSDLLETSYSYWQGPDIESLPRGFEKITLSLASRCSPAGYRIHYRVMVARFGLKVDNFLRRGSSFPSRRH